MLLHALSSAAGPVATVWHKLHNLGSAVRCSALTKWHKLTTLRAAPKATPTVLMPAAPKTPSMLNYVILGRVQEVPVRILLPAPVPLLLLASPPVVSPPPYVLVGLMMDYPRAPIRENAAHVAMSPPAETTPATTETVLLASNSSTSSYFSAGHDTTSWVAAAESSIHAAVQLIYTAVTVVGTFLQTVTVTLNLQQLLLLTAVYLLGYWHASTKVRRSIATA